MIDVFVQLIIFACAVAIVWYFAGTLIQSVHRIARRFNKRGFLLAFFLLGALTSVSEISVALNSGLSGVPSVSVGNLIGASFVILLFIVPLLAALGRGVTLRSTVSKRNFFLVLMTVSLPALLVIDGDVTRTEGMLAVLAYGTLAYMLYHQRGKPTEDDDDLPAEVLSKTTATLLDIGRIMVGGAAIFLASRFLVDQAVYFSSLLTIPASLVGLVLLSLGTNIPEIVIAVRAVLRHKTDIALGDYLGSAAMNTLIFGVLGLFAGTFLLEVSEFVVTAALLIAGLIFLFLFARSNYLISRREGLVLLLFYAAFIAFQAYTIFRFTVD